jgi:hypothetical protein
MPRVSTKRRIWIGLALAVAILVAGSFVWAMSDPLHARARRQWASQAIDRINQRASDTAWLENESARLKSTAATQPYGGSWVGDELLVMKNGQWLICQNICTKEQHTPVRRDIFIGRGSNGRWYYSTSHFCVGKCVLQMERQPESLAQFVDGYWLVPFDGKPEQCLEETWTGGPFGPEKMQSAAAPNGTKTEETE